MQLQVISQHDRSDILEERTLTYKFTIRGITLYEHSMAIRGFQADVKDTQLFIRKHDRCQSHLSHAVFVSHSTYVGTRMAIRKIARIRSM